MSEIKELLKKDATFFDNEGGGKCVNISRDIYDQVLTLLDQQPTSEFTKKTDRRLKYTCPKCGKQFPKFMGEEFRGHVTYCQELKYQQPTSGEFADIFRKFLNYPDTELNPRDPVQWQDMSLESCDHLDRAKSINKDLLVACKRTLGAMSCDELNNGRVFNDELRKEVKEYAKAAIAKAKKEGA